MVATQLYNLAQGFAKIPKSKTPAQYLPLPLIDGAPKPPAALDPAWWAKMEALAAASGMRFANSPHD